MLKCLSSKNLSSNDIEETIDEMEKLIAKSQMIMLPGGFQAVTSLTVQVSSLQQHSATRELQSRLTTFSRIVTVLCSVSVTDSRLLSSSDLFLTAKSESLKQ